jgi:hypothetical protein
LNEKQSPILRVALNFIEGEKFAITPLTILSILVFLNLSSKPLNAATSLPVVICSSVPSTKSILNKSMILLRLLSSLVSSATFEFSNTGGVANSCSSEPDLPSGLAVILTSGSCKISGVPTLLQDVITYTIKAINSVGYSTATVNISFEHFHPKLHLYR